MSAEQYNRLRRIPIVDLHRIPENELRAFIALLPRCCLVGLARVLIR